MLDKNAAAGAPSRAPGRLGRYELIDRIADGGMAEVYLARQLGPMNFQKIVVVKKIHPNLARQKEFIGMLLDEARVSALIKHPRVVDIYDLGISRGTYFIAMEYLAGQPLSRVITRGRARTPLDVYSTARIIADAAEGLDAAHNLKTLSGRALELVHRDVSPSNIIVLYDGNVKLVDFGVAKARGRITETGNNHIKGKVGYVSPEQIMENPVDRRSDVYSLGVVMWEALALRRLFDAESEAGKLKQILDGVPLPPSAHRPEIPYELDRICLRALAIKPEERFQTAREMQLAIEEFLRDAGYRREAGAIQRFMSATFAAEQAQQEKLLRRVCEADPAAGAGGAAGGPAGAHRVGAGDQEIDTGVQTFVREPGELSSVAIGSGALPAGPAAQAAGATGGVTGTTLAVGTPPNRPVLPVSAIGSASARTPIERPIPVPVAGGDSDSIVTEVPRARGKRGSSTPAPVGQAPAGALRQSSRLLPLRAPPAPEPKEDEEGPSVVTDVDEADDYRDVTEVDSAAELRFDVLVPPTAVPGAAGDRGAAAAAPEPTREVEGSGRVAKPAGKGPCAREKRPGTAPPVPPSAKAKAKAKAKAGAAANASASAKPAAAAAKAGDSAPPAVAALGSGVRPAAASAGAPEVPTVIREMGEPVPVPPPEPADFPLIVEGRSRKLLWAVLGGVGAAAALLAVVIVWAIGRGAASTRDRAVAAAGESASVAEALAAAADPEPAASATAAADTAAPAAPAAAADTAAAAAAASATAPAEAPAPATAAKAIAAENTAAEKNTAGRPAAEKPSAEKPPAEKPATASDRARAEREAAPVRRPSGNPVELYREGARLYLSGDLAAARSKFQAALAVSSRFAPAHRGLGLIYERTGSKAHAIRSLETYLRLAPRAPDAAAVRARIERLRK